MRRIASHHVSNDPSLKIFAVTAYFMSKLKRFFFLSCFCTSFKPNMIEHFLSFDYYIVSLPSFNNNSFFFLRFFVYVFHVLLDTQNFQQINRRKLLVLSISNSHKKRMHWNKRKKKIENFIIQIYLHANIVVLSFFRSLKFLFSLILLLSKQKKKSQQKHVIWLVCALSYRYIHFESGQQFHSFSCLSRFIQHTMKKRRNVYYKYRINENSKMFEQFEGITQMNNENDAKKKN